MYKVTTKSFHKITQQQHGKKILKNKKNESNKFRPKVKNQLCNLCNKKYCCEIKIQKYRNIKA